MTRRLQESAVVRSVSEIACLRIAQSVIRALQQLKAELSRADSRLSSAWEELYVQIQGEQSFDFEAYEDTVEQLLEVELAQLLPYEREAIWLQSSAGELWNIADEDTREPYPIVDEDIADYLIKKYIYSEASDWSNRRIRKYLERSSASDDA
jgi:hypothetical protein